MSKVAYQIRVVGEVTPDLLDDFGHIAMSVDPVGTTMHAEFVDAAQLHGFLGALRRDGVELVDIQREQPWTPQEDG